MMTLQHLQSKGSMRINHHNKHILKLITPCVSDFFLNLGRKTLMISELMTIGLEAEATISNKGAESEVTPQYKRDNLAQPNKSIPAFAVLAGAPTRECSAISSSDDEDKEANVLRRYSEIWESIPAKNSLECNR